MGIVRLTLFTVAGVGAAMLWFGRDDGLPADRLGRDRSAEMENLTETLPLPEPDSVAVPALQPGSAPQAPVQTQAPPDPVPKPTPPPDPPQQPDPVAAAVAEAVNTAAEPDPAAEAPTGVLYVTGSRVNMRAGPGTDFGVVSALGKGTAVDDLGEAGDGWNKIRVIATGELGFMATRFLSQVEP